MLFPHELYQKMSPELAAAGLAYLRKEDRDTYKTGLSSLAIQRKLRPAFIQKRSGDKQIEWMIDMLKMRTSVAVGEHMLQTWLMKEHTDMLVMLLDKLEIDHDGEGSVEGELPEELDGDKLEEGIKMLLSRKDSEVVAIYLHMFKLQRPVDWENLGKLLETDERLALGGASAAEAEAEEAAAETDETAAEAEEAAAETEEAAAETEETAAEAEETVAETEEAAAETEETAPGEEK
ncbi:MAG: methyl-accepting chemotaxis protein [Verrucomicrobiales bacterium]|jgi:methyl-accepting chemotaxis protein